MSADCILEYARETAAELHRKMLSLRHKSVKKRVNKMKKYASALFPRSPADPEKALVGPFEKRVNENYVADVVGQLSACPASETSVYYRNRPVDLVEFLRALCSFDVASHALPPAERSGPRISGQHFSGYVIVKNAERRGDAFLNEFVAFVGGAVKMREFTSQVDYDACVESTKKKTHKVIAFDNPFFTSPSAREDLKVCISYGVPDLTVEEILGKLWRGGELRALGFESELVALIDSENKRYSPNCAVGKVVKAACGELSGAWALSVTSEPDGMYPSRGETDILITFGRPFGETDLQIIVDEGLLRRWVSLHATAIKEYLAEIQPQTLRKQLSAGDIIRAMRSQSSSSTLSRQRSLDASPPLVHGPTTEVVRVGIAPPRVTTRNAWILKDSSELCVKDPAVKIRVDAMKRKLGERCARCPPDAATPQKTRELPCANLQCKAKFWCAQSGTHYIWRENEERIDIDMHLPLFDKQVLAALNKKTSYL